MKVNGLIKDTWHKQLKVPQTKKLIELKSAYIDWINAQQWQIEFTLGRHANWYKSQAISAAGYFGQCLDKSLYGNARRRFGKSFERIMCLEYAAMLPTKNSLKTIKNIDEYGCWHIHGVARIPSDGRADYLEIKRIIERSWDAVLKLKYGKFSKTNFNVGVYYDLNDGTSLWQQYTSKQFDESFDTLLISASHLNV